MADAKLKYNDSIQRLLNAHEIVRTHVPLGTQLPGGAGVPLGGTITTIFDGEDRPIEMQTRDADGQIIGRIVRTYNAAGLLIEEKPIVENPIVENPAPMFLDRFPTDGQEQPTEAYLQALNKGLRTLMSGRAQSGTWHTYDAQNRIKMVREINFAFEKPLRSFITSEATRPSGVELSLETLSCRWALRILSKKMAS
jgi:hypothetical protein